VAAGHRRVQQSHRRRGQRPRTAHRACRCVAAACAPPAAAQLSRACVALTRRATSCASEAHMALQDFDACIADSQKALKMLRGSNDAEQRATYVAHTRRGYASLSLTRKLFSLRLSCVVCACARVASCRVACRVHSRRCHVQIGLAYLAMEKYESARDAFQASLKGRTHSLTHSRSALGSHQHTEADETVSVRVCAWCVNPKTKN
jgi:tetratricopeptide (TPR) repeat protein